jgi:secreted protein with Ig-like and vWFA domain
MNHDPNDIKNGELDQARLTAYALEQLEGAERAAVEALLAGSDRSRYTVEEIRALAAEVKKAAGQEAPPLRSPELRVVLEQYLPNEEVTEMDAKPEPASGKASRHSRRRSTLIWAAAVCALVAAIPGYVLISGSLRQGLQSVAIEDSISEAPADAYDPAGLTRKFSYEESDEDLSAVNEFTGDLAEARIMDVSAEGESLGVTAGKRQQPTDDGSVVVSREMAQTLTARRLDKKPSKPAPFAVPAEPESAGVADEAHGVAGKHGVTVGMQAPEVFSADRDTLHFGLQVPQSGGMDVRSASTDSMGIAPKLASPPETGAPISTANNPRFLAASKAPAPTAGGRGGMMGGSAPAGAARGVGAGMGGMGMGEPDATARSVGQSDPTARQSVDTVYTIEKSFVPYPNGPPISVARQSSAAGQRPVEVELVEDLSVIVLKGKEKDRKSVRRLIEEREAVSWYAPYGRSLGTEQYDPIVENPFLSAADNPESTFSVDVDTASYANIRRFLDSGRLPPPNAVRIEELVNYFRYDYPQPDGEVPFSVNVETAQCPWDTEHRLVRIGLKGREIDPEQRGPGNLVFLLDVSGSMRDENKLPLVQYAMGMLVDQLTEDDRVAIVTYAGEAGVALDSTSGEKRKKIRRAIDNLSAGGSTHGSAGIVMAYDQAMQHFVENGTNRVILCTDGDLNVGITDDDELVKLIGQQAKSGVFLTVLGFGTGNLKDSKMEKLADKGNGIYAYVDGRREARRVLVQQMAGSLVTIAKDVKIQIEFNPAEVASYRLIGYENRIMAAEDFANDKKDAGEIGAGHTVTALYEIVPGGAGSGGELGRELKYQRKTGRELTEAADSGELLTLKLRYKEPDGKKSKLLEFVQKDSDNKFGQASSDFRFASSVAAFGMLLRGSQHAGDLNWSAVEEFAAGSLGEDPGGYRNEFLELVHRAGELRSR